VPATQTKHLPFQPKVLEAIKQAGLGYSYVLHVGEANEKGWQYVVDSWNCLADRVIKENFDYVLFVESDVVIPENALSHLLSLNVDVALAVVPWHNYPNNPDMQAIYKDLVCCAKFTEPDDTREYESLRFNSLKMGDVKDRVLTFKDGAIEGGTGCILIKKEVFESGIRFICRFQYASYDVYFWRDIRRRGFSAAIDGYVICEHLDDVSFQDEKGNPVFENLAVTTK
jgi:hypothetical protein